MNNNTTQISKFLSLILRHKPETVGLTLDERGWVEVDALLTALHAAGTEIDRNLLQHIVDTNDKKRFVFSDDGRRIRASQGHSLAVDPDLAATPPPDILYHGTASRFLASIRQQGLIPGSRQHVHLSRDRATAHAVGIRHGSPVVLSIDTRRMHADGHIFFLSTNGVWLTTSVPVDYIDFGGF